MNAIRRVLIGDLKSHIKPYLNQRLVQQGSDYLEWLGANLVVQVEKFVTQEKIAESSFVIGMNNLFQTDRFEQMVKRWITDYLVDIYGIINAYAHMPSFGKIRLPDNPINRFAVDEYHRKFEVLPEIEWVKKEISFLNLFHLFVNAVVSLGVSLKNGIYFKTMRKSFKVMREAIGPLQSTKRFYHCPDFFVDENIIRKSDLLLFSRGLPVEPVRLNAYQQLASSGYANFDLHKLSIGWLTLIQRIFPKYAWQSQIILFREVGSSNFSLFSSVYLYFMIFAIPYERVFSHFRVNVELGHNFFSASHIAEFIICQNYGVKYYLFHWSDHAINIDSHLVAYLSCDKYLLWGPAHILGVEGAEILESFGYIFKELIYDVRNHREEMLNLMGVMSNKKVVSFFDESFGGECKIQERDYIDFWEIIKNFAKHNTDVSVIVKPKEIKRVNNLSPVCREEYEKIRSEIDLLRNVYVLDETKWSFVQAIGVADVVLTLSMTSSATIALTCGIPAFYYDRDRFIHPFALRLKDKIVFNDKKKIIEAISKTLRGEYDPLKLIPEFVMRSFDACRDDSALHRLRLLLSGEFLPPLAHTPNDWNVGIVVQARMGSTRLPGKIMMTLAGRPVLSRVIQRLQECQKTWKVIIATTDNEQDDPVAQLSRSCWADVYRGSEEDVLKRYYESALAFKLDVVIRVTSDCPLIDPEIIDAMIEQFKYENVNGRHCDYLSNTQRRTFPRGLDVEIFTFEALKRAHQEASSQPQREHVTPYIYQNPEKFIVRDYIDREDHSDLRWTLDEQDDYRLLSHVYDSLYPQTPHFRYKDVLNLVKIRPELIAVNARIQQKAL